MVTANKRKPKVTEVHSEYHQEKQLQDKVKERRKRGLVRRLTGLRGSCFSHSYSIHLRIHFTGSNDRRKKLTAKAG
ncbi:hypothetical protein [Guptibacillus hwajinpoensis]|uniref:hypothetical protein n=1 Tax=Guptibacillus hwajinpoensis TaxID=208199 RepID=UPI00273DEA5D|nr:hypothetical protein [Pseudalkalibacillus hwajinpoensis]WLR58051.1 hypothetical protein LC071_12220 [Pseudalkalibacillus hwajinpoensis]